MRINTSSDFGFLWHMFQPEAKELALWQTDESCTCDQCSLIWTLWVKSVIRDVSLMLCIALLERMELKQKAGSIKVYFNFIMFLGLFDALSPAYLVPLAPFRSKCRPSYSSFKYVCKCLIAGLSTIESTVHVWYCRSIIHCWKPYFHMQLTLLTRQTVSSLAFPGGKAQAVEVW